jgi:hypothetical protein
MATILQISRFENEYQVAIMPEGRVVHYLDRTKVPPSLRESIIKKLESLSDRAFYADTSEEELTGEAQLSSIGRQVYRAFIPATAREALSYLYDVGVRNLEIATNDIEIPWYLMHDGQDFLCLRYVVGRTIQTSASFPLIEAESKGRLDILFISDPTEDLPSTRREVSRIMENVRSASDFVAVDVLEGKDATIDRLMYLLMSKEHSRFPK